MRIIKIVLVLIAACYATNLFAACREEIKGNVGCERGDTVTIPSENARYRQCMNVRVIIDSVGNPLSAKHYTCGGGAWVYLSDHEYVCEVAAKNDCN